MFRSDSREHVLPPQKKREEQRSLMQYTNSSHHSDPWWIFTIINLFWNIKFRYELGFLEIVHVSPRFAILLLCMTLSVICIIIDLLSVTPVIPIGVINPFWKFAFVFKCFTDSIILDDFKAALDKLSRHRRAQILPFDILGDNGSVQDLRISPMEAVYQKGSGTSEAKRPDVNRARSGQSSIELFEAHGPRCPSPAIIQHVENTAVQRN